MSTLLGPEEAAASQGADSANALILPLLSRLIPWAGAKLECLTRPVVAGPRTGVRDAWFRPYLENYTVDASIFWSGSLPCGGGPVL